MRPLAVAGRRLGAAEDPPDFFLDQRPKRLPAPAAFADHLHDLLGGGDADVRGDERLFERLDRFDVNRLAAPRRFIRLPDDFVEPSDELFFRTGE